MRSIHLAVLTVVLSASTALAEQAGSQKPGKLEKPVRPQALKGPGGGNPCAAFGPGFVKVEGSDTCMRIGGGIDVGAGAGGFNGGR